MFKCLHTFLIFSLALTLWAGQCFIPMGQLQVWAQNPSPSPTASPSAILDKGTPKPISGYDTPIYLNALNMLVVGFVGVSIAKNCKPLTKPSVIAYMLTSAFFLYSEISTFMKYRKASEERMLVNTGDDYQVQLNKMQQARDITQAALDYAKSKQKNMMIVSIGYGASAGIALVEGFVEKTPLKCTLDKDPAGDKKPVDPNAPKGAADPNGAAPATGNSPNGASGTTPSSGAPPTGTCSGGACPVTPPVQAPTCTGPTCGGSGVIDASFQVPSAFSHPLKSQLKATTGDLESLMLFTEWHNFNEGAETKQSPSIHDFELLQKNKKSLGNTSVLRDMLIAFSELNLEEFAVKAQNMLISSAHAQTPTASATPTAAVDTGAALPPAKLEPKTLLPMLGLVGGAAASFFLIKKTAESPILKGLEKGPVRAVVFGASAGLAYASYTMSKKQVKELEERVKEYDKLILGLKDLKGDVIHGTTSIFAIDTSNQQLPPNRSTQLPDGRNCLTGTVISGNLQTDPTCSCIATNSCTSAEATTSQGSEVGINIPGTLKNGVSTVAGELNAASTGNLSAGTGLDSGSVGQAKAIGDLNRDLEGKLEKNLGLSSINDQKGKFLNDMETLASSAVNKNGGPGAMASSPYFQALNPVTPPSNPAVQAVVLPTDPQPSSVAAGGGGAAAKSEALAKKEVLENPFAGMNLGSGISAGGGLLPSEVVSESERTLANYNDKSNDIVENANEDLFKVISLRYWRTGYPLLLDRESPKAP